MNKEKIAKKLAELRGSRTQSEVAEYLGISQSAYAMYETGDRIPRDEIKIKLAKLYHKSVEAIFYKE